MSHLIKGCLVLCLLAAFPAAAHADLQTIDFDIAPPALGSPVDSVGDVSFPTALGFRPYRADVGARAHSGTAVGDLGRCVEEEEAGGGEAGGCEFFQAQTTGALARTARSVTLFAGRFGPVGPGDPPEQAVLTAFDATGTQIATTGPVAIDASGFNTRLSVSDPAGRIARFRVEARLGPLGENDNAGDLGIDDLSVDFAEGGRPDFSLSTTNQVVPVVQGQQAEAPVQIARLDGSNGPIRLSVSGLPEGVSAAPVTVPGSQTTATIVLRAELTAPDTGFVPTDATITASPMGDANVAPGPRTATLGVRVASDFGVSIYGHSEASPPPGGQVLVQAPDCAPVDLPLKVSRDIAFDQDISLSLREDTVGATGLPTGLTAQILPSSIVSPGGGLVAERALRFTADYTAGLGIQPLQLTLEGRAGGPSGSRHALPLKVVRATPKATIADSRPGSGIGYTPRFGREGTRVQIHGTGFCRGTGVIVGNPYSFTTTTFVDNHTIEFTMPRYATTGRVTIVPPGSLPNYQTEDALVVDSVRNVDGFQFVNPHFNSLSLSEFTRAFGADDVFVSVNPCWPVGDCRVTTGILDPTAAIEWEVLNHLYGAHCFGMSLGIEQLKSGTASYREFTAKRGARVFDLPEWRGPSASLESFLDAEQVRQYSDEFLTAWYRRSKALNAQLTTLEREFDHSRLAMVHLDGGDGEGHVLLAYDLVEAPKTTDLYVYDPNEAFQPAEDESGDFHHQAVDYSVIHIDRESKTWSFQFEPGNLWTGGTGDGTLSITRQGVIPADPSLPGLSSLTSHLASLTFGSSRGSARTRSASPGAELLPASDGAPGRGSGGTWVSGDRKHPLEVSFEGTGDGHYTEAYTAPGFIASVSDVATSRGVVDTVSGRGDSMAFASGSDRPLTVELARRSTPKLSTSASVETHASAGGSDTVGFAADGALTYARDGAPTQLSFRLTEVRSDGGPTTFVSAPVTVRRGDHLRVEPVDRDLRRVRLEVRDARGALTTKVLRNRGRVHGHIRLGPPRLYDHHLVARVKLAGVAGRVVAGVSLRLMRGHRLIARRAIALRNADGARRIAWKLPARVEAGRYRLLTDVRALTAGARGSTATGNLTAHRSAAVTVGR